jgi:hypothetical protein
MQRIQAVRKHEEKGTWFIWGEEDAQMDAALYQVTFFLLPTLGIRYH